MATIHKQPPKPRAVVSAKGPLGPTWQPVYDTLYSVLMQAVNLPHLAVLTFLGIAFGTLNGSLSPTPAMPLVAVFVMGRVPFVGCCMSVCLHRYFAHGAFKTSRVGQFVVGFFACMALQGGPLWWGGKHRRHHRFCDEPSDPHSALHTSYFYAWLGWLYCETKHDWAFVPPSCCTPEMLLLNLLFFVPNALVTAALVPFVGLEWALFLCWVPGIFGALATTHFNVEYHPPEDMRSDGRTGGECLGINKPGGDTGIGPLRLDWVARYAPWMFEPTVGEAYHDDHHDHPFRARRPGYDVPYYAVLKPLAQLGLVWDLRQPLDEADADTGYFTGKIAPPSGLLKRE